MKHEIITHKILSQEKILVVGDIVYATIYEDTKIINCELYYYINF